MYATYSKHESFQLKSNSPAILTEISGIRKSGHFSNLSVLLKTLLAQNFEMAKKTKKKYLVQIVDIGTYFRISLKSEEVRQVNLA